MLLLLQIACLETQNLNCLWFWSLAKAGVCVIVNVVVVVAIAYIHRIGVWGKLKFVVVKSAVVVANCKHRNAKSLCGLGCLGKAVVCSC